MSTYIKIDLEEHLDDIPVSTLMELVKEKLTDNELVEQIVELLNLDIIKAEKLKSEIKFLTNN